MRHFPTILSLAVLAFSIGGCTGGFARIAPRGSSADARGEEGSLGERPILDVTTPADLPTLPELMHMRFAQLRPEMTINEFKALFPEAYFVKRERVRWSEHPIDAYELLVRQRYRFARDPQDYVQAKKAWFYFLGSGLESWGEPESWPSPPPDK